MSRFRSSGGVVCLIGGFLSVMLIESFRKGMYLSSASGERTYGGIYMPLSSRLPC